uniref:PdxH_2 protein n=1 Tax=Fopius arisanus TaxID=64838 RepID=A0A0C9RNM5_9HYME
MPYSFQYHKLYNRINLTIQARIEGKAEICPKHEIQKFYDADPLYCKIRAHLCHQDALVDWNQLNKRHDQLLEEAKMNNSALPMPDHLSVMPPDLFLFNFLN